MEKDKINLDSGKVKLALFAALLLSLGIFYLAAPQLFHKVWRLATGGNIHKTVEYIRSFGAGAIVFSFLLDVVVNTVGFLPSIFLSTANGLIFGLPLGILVSWLAESTGVILSFLFMRFFLRSSAEKLIVQSNNLRKIDEMSSKNGLAAMALLRTLPYFPSGVLTALGAVSKMSIRDYCLATLIGKFPSTAIEVVVGHDAVNFHANLHRLTFMVLAITLVYVFIIWRKKQREKHAEIIPDDSEKEK